MQRTAFTPLALFLRPPRAEPPEPEPSPSAARADPLPLEYAEALGAARRFHAGLRDALEVAVAQCLRKISSDVIGREMQLAQADIAEIVKSALDSVPARDVLSIRANPRDLAALTAFGFELIGDAALRPGDVELALRTGTIDLTLAARLDTALALWNA